MELEGLIMTETINEKVEDLSNSYKSNTLMIVMIIDTFQGYQRQPRTIMRLCRMMNMISLCMMV
jgi:hypothetical protein